MRPVIPVLATLMLFALFAPVAPALPAEPLNNGMMFGGQWAEANNTSVSTTNLSDLPAVVEVYTATWCENCVDVEHALDDVLANGGNIQQYHVHRAIGETQDPFGSEYIDARWNSKYGGNAPPAVVFNGTMKKIGSVTDEASLESEFSNIASNDLQLGEGTTSFSWTPTSTTNDQSGIVTWSLDIDAMHLENSTLNVTAWVVEGHAEFEEGSNGLGTYPHIVRDIIALGDELQGNSTIDLPTPHDGDDLQIHLIYEIIPIPEEPDEPAESNESEGDDSLPFLSPMAVIALLTVSALVHNNRLNRTTRQVR